MNADLNCELFVIIQTIGAGAPKDIKHVAFRMFLLANGGGGTDNAAEAGIGGSWSMSPKNMKL